MRKKAEKKENKENLKDMKTEETRINERTSNIKTKEKNQGPKGYLRRQLKILFFIFRPCKWELFFLICFGFLFNFETSHAIATSAAAIKRSSSLECRACEHPCSSEAKILSLWHTFNISGCTFTSISVST